jgi:hypothetical protein
VPFRLDIREQSNWLNALNQQGQHQGLIQPTIQDVRKNIVSHEIMYLAKDSLHQLVSDSADERTCSTCTWVEVILVMSEESYLLTS